MCTNRVLVALWLLLASTGCTCGAQSSHPEFREPTGPYAVGMREFAWKDPTRPEPRTRDENDHPAMIVRVYWPVDRADVEGAERARFLDPDEFNTVGRISLDASGITSDIQVPAYENAPLARGSGKFNVLLSSPGYTSARMLNSYQGLDAASHGYVVFCVEHLGDGVTRWESPFTKKEFKIDTDLKEPFKDSEWNLAHVTLPRWIGDMSAVIDQLQAEAHGTASEVVFGHELVDRLNLERFGAMGWSLGGSTAINLQKTEPRIAASVSFDGVPRETNSDPFTHPVLLLASNDTYKQSEMYRQSLANVVRSARGAGAYSELYIVKGKDGIAANHDIYADGHLLGASDEDKPLVAAQQVAITRPAIAFFDAVFEDRPVAEAVEGAVADNAEFLEKVDIQ